MGVDPHSATLLADAPGTGGSLDVAPVAMAGRYELLGLLGSGAMGTVTKASPS